MYTLREEGDRWNKMDVFLYIFVKMLKRKKSRKKEKKVQVMKYII
jgi:hypothetical protein